MVKKVLLIAMVALMGLMCHRAEAQQCDTVRVFPWNNDFYNGLGCWTQLGDSSSLWRLNADDTYSFANAAYIAAPADSVANGCVLVSPALALPADTANMQLSFKTRRVGAVMNLRVLVSTGLRENLADYDTLLNVTPAGSNTYEVNLSAYAGQTVYVAFSVQKPNATNIVTFFGVGSVNIVSDRMPQGDWYGQNIAVRTGDTVEHEFDLTHGLENDSNTVFSWHSTMVEAGLATMVEEVTDMYQYYGYDSVRTLPRSIYRLIYHTQGTDTMTLTVSNIYGTITTQSVSRIYDCQPIATFPTVLEYNLIALCGYSDNLYPYYTSSSSYTFGDEDGGLYTNTIPYMRSNVNYGYRGYVVTPRIVVPAEGDPVSLMLRYRRGPLEVRATTADVTDTALFTDLLYTEPGSTFLRTRKVSLTSYAGDTVRLAIIHKGGTTLDIMPDMNVDYDTLPFVHSIALPTKTRTDSSTLCTATLRYGATEELHYTWASALGGTFVTNALGDSAWVTYSTGGIDTVTVTVTNAYGSHSKTGTLRVIDCTPQTILPWKETFYDGIPCWWKPDSSNWYTDNPYAYNDNYRALISMYSNNDEWIVSKAITIPADTAAMTILEWEDKADMGNVSHQPNYSVLVSTSADRTDLTAYDTLLTVTSGVINGGSGWRNKTLRSVSLAAYAGQTVHVAFCSHPAYYASEGGISTEKLIIDNVTVRTASTPLITLASNASTYYWGDTARFTATLVEGSPNGLTYTWHSTLLDSTITINSNLLTLNYPVSGTDTLTVIATNAYGSDTASVIVNSVIITQPEVTLQHTEANVGVPTVYTAVLNRCITTGLTYTWHSTMLNQSSVASGQWSVMYSTEGIDTVTIIVNTLYGTDTAVAVVEVQNCAPRAIPYSENFNGITATAADIAGNLPECWNYNWNGSNAAYAPHVITTGGYQYMNDLPDNALFFVAGSSTGYGSTAIVRLPRFADSLQHLALALDYRFESNGKGTLTVGWFDNNEVFHSVKSLTSHAGGYLHDTVLFTDHIAADYRIALWWEYGSSWYAAAVDNIEVFVDNSIHAPANLAVDNIGAHSARVTWAAVDSASAYHVRINGVVDTTVSGLACNLTGLSPHTEYTVQVAAIVGTETGRYASTTFTTLCGTVPMPYNNNFSQGESSVECWTSSNLNQFYQSGYMIIWSGLSTKPSYQTTPIVAHPGNQMEVSFRARKSTSTTESGRLIVGVMTDPADTTTFTAIDTFMTTGWNEYRFITRTLDTTPVAIAFCVGTGDGEFCNVAIDDLSIEVSIDCATLLTAEAVVQDARSVELSWQYDNYGRLDPEGVLIDLYDLTSGVNTAFVAHGTDTTLVFPFLYHSYHAELQVLCGSDTSEALSLDWAPDPCTAPEASASADTHSIVLSWQRLGSENLWVVEYRAVGSATWDTAGSTDSTSFTIAGLTQATHYEVRVGSLCIEGDTLYGNTLSVTTLCGRFGLPYSHDFSTGEAGCWFVPCGIISDATSYSSGGARMDDFMAQPRPIRSPEFDRDLNGLIVRYTVNGDRFFSSMIKVGVSDADGQNPLWLDSTIAAEGTHEYSYSFENFTGTQRHIIFYGDFITYLIRVQVDSVVSCQPVSNLEVTHLSDTAATLQWSPSVWPGQWAVYLDGVLLGTTNDTTFLLDGLQSQTDYVASVSQVCSASDTSVSRSLLFSTPCQPFTLPYSMDFENEYRLDSICWRTILYPYCSYPSASINGTSSRNLFIVAVSSGYNTENYDTSYRNFACSPLIDPQGQGVDISFRASLWSFDATSFFEVGIMADVADTAGFIPLGNVTPSSSSFTYINHQFSVAAATLPQPFCLAFRFGGTLIRCYIDDISITASIPVTHELTLSVNDTAMGTVSGAGTYEEGSNITFSAIPNEGYHFVMWNDSVTIATRTVKLETDTAFTAFFAPDSTPVIPDTVWYTVTVNRVCRDCNEEIPDDYVIGEGTYQEGATVTLEGHVGGCQISLDFWIDEVGDTIFDNPYSFVITSDRTLTAVFGSYGSIGDVENSDFRLYPNPASTTVTIETDRPASLTLTDATGRECGRWKVEIGKNTIDISSLPAGVYFVRLAGTNNVRKLIIK